MLSVAKLARGREDYYLATVASGREEAGVLAEPEGRWLGQAAAALGLAGTVDGPGLRALLTGVDPVTGEVLSAHHDRVRVAAYDCTYSTPKSVSVLHALGPEDVRTQVRAGHEEAAAAALGYLERSWRPRPAQPGTRRSSVVDPGRRLRGGGVSPPDQPRARPPPSQPCARREPGTGTGRSLVGTRRPWAVPGAGHGP